MNSSNKELQNGTLIFSGVPKLTLTGDYLKRKKSSSFALKAGGSLYTLTTLIISHYNPQPTENLEVEKGKDNSNLGRWVWTRYRGRNNQTLRIIAAYRPNPPSGPFTVYAQQNAYFHSIGKTCDYS
jgi:hypothetical protein